MDDLLTSYVSLLAAMNEQKKIEQQSPSRAGSHLNL